MDIFFTLVSTLAIIYDSAESSLQSDQAGDSDFSGGSSSLTRPLIARYRSSSTTTTSPTNSYPTHSHPPRSPPARSPSGHHPQAQSPAALSHPAQLPAKKSSPVRFELLLRKHYFPQDRYLQAYFKKFDSLRRIPTDREYRILLNLNGDIFAIVDDGQIRKLYDENDQPATINTRTKVIRKPEPDETFILDCWMEHISKF